MERSVGILFPISSLPGNQGIGDFGKHTFRLIDAISKQHIKIWQILPLNALGYGNSPYQPLSSYAGDEVYISVDTLADYGLLKQSSIRNFNKFSERVDYQGVREFKEPYLKKAYKAFLKSYDKFESEYQLFCSSAQWLYPYAVFITLKKKNGMQSWTEWNKDEKEWIKNRKFSLKGLEEQINYEQFIQFIFYKQWQDIKTYANKHHVQIMGDIPFYVGLDSADVWQNQEDFLLNAEVEPIFVAGVPPDYFSADGQRWGNPIYNWKVMSNKRFDFWMQRLAWNDQYFDILRLDHFRAFDTYWKIPASCPSAKEGEWVLGPSYEFFDELYRRMPSIHIIAEDLGDLRKQVGKLRDHYLLLGMNVLQFELTPKQLKKSRKEKVILYTGTHDNNTLEGYYQTLTQNQKISLRRFFHNLGYENRTFHELIIRYCLESKAEVVILPVQDILGVKEEGRINTPSTIGSPNWEWKLKNLKDVYNLLPSLGEMIALNKRY
ncbi:MAG: 4-alpha-glucanotransferase [Longicatena sp.]